MFIFFNFFVTFKCLWTINIVSIPATFKWLHLLKYLHLHARISICCTFDMNLFSQNSRLFSLFLIVDNIFINSSAASFKCFFYCFITFLHITAEKRSAVAVYCCNIAEYFSSTEYITRQQCWYLLQACVTNICVTNICRPV